MGPITKKLFNAFKSALSRGDSPYSKLQADAHEAVPEDQRKMMKNRDPLHAVYAATTNLTSQFVELAVDHSAARAALKFIGPAKDLYCPGYPPMSPITHTYFVAWTLFDVPFGSGRETMGDCFAGLSELLKLGEMRQRALTELRRSRMGIYEVMGQKGELVRLRELVTETEVDALLASGFKGQNGQLIFVRLLPALDLETNYSVALTTPYVLGHFTEQDWLDYFARHRIVASTQGVEDRLYRHMKYGIKPDYWIEYAFWGYANYRPDSILLSGFPDRPDTQPQHRAYADRMG